MVGLGFFLRYTLQPRFIPTKAGLPYLIAYIVSPALTFKPSSDTMRSPHLVVISVCAVMATVLVLFEHSDCPPCGVEKGVKIQAAGRLNAPSGRPAKFVETLSNNQASLNKVREGGLADYLVDEDIDALTDEQLFVTIHSYLDNENIHCRRKLRMGKVGDGGWEICDDIDVRPEPPCIIYSFGINYDFSFDDDSSKMYKCHVYSFDPSMKRMHTYNRSSLVHFYKEGLLDKTQFLPQKNWSVHSYADIRAMLGHQNAVIDVIKMDIEGSEWPAISNMIETNQFNNVRQFLVEYHFSVKMGRNMMLSKLKTIQAVEKAGFKKFHVHKNPACKFRTNLFPVLRTSCYEVHYIKR